MTKKALKNRLFLAIFQGFGLSVCHYLTKMTRYLLVLQNT